jgi:hypothetical protein
MIESPTTVADTQTEIRLAFLTFVIFPENKIVLLVKRRVSATWTVHMLKGLMTV